MELSKTKRIIGKVALYSLLSMVLLAALAFISVVRPTDAPKVTESIENSILYITKPTPVIVDNRITFCDEKITGDKLEFLLDGISSTESEHGLFRPRNHEIKKSSWTARNKYSTARGKFQMLQSTRDAVANYLHEKKPTEKEFLKDTAMQVRYIVTYLEMCNDEFKHVNEHDRKGNCIHAKDKDGKDIKDEYVYYNAYERYVGQFINGYHITKSGLIAMAQATGVAGTIKWLEHGCQSSDLPKGTPIADRRLTIQVF